MNNLPKVVAQQRCGRASNPRLLDRKSDALPLSHRATKRHYEIPTRLKIFIHHIIMIACSSDKINTKLYNKNTKK